MNTTQRSIIAIACCVAVSLGSAIVYPESDLRKMDPVDACLFICNICLEGKAMMKCVHDICFTGRTSLFMGALWIGRNCKKYERVMPSLFEKQLH